ncbi:Tellurium resistance [Kitasatospora purpeofusca]|uniref:Tellurium resistance n=1 Tax=Kitasatospora purpeofusca TaxID=67352 RepID=UPI002255380A|nr:Tellurium resistance [Kitasatospora purpeofusca]MCX4752621.1 Tellurium resistance [Kitasatospora purpeofusca]WSR32186.1 Tellurium resistance [Kitasatospora purpeofusca]WSR40084.1 Tellurium resistance [Kitasatospora purpeofusca]
MASIWEYLRGERNALDTGGQFKVTLTKSSPHHAITGAAATTGYLYVNLHWTTRIGAPRASARDSLRRVFTPRILSPMEPDSSQNAQVNVDLDLACMYELSDGKRGVVQPLGGFFGDLRNPPYIKLSGDDQYGAPSGETMYVNLEKKDQFKRLLIFVYIYDGTPAFEQTNAVVTIVPQSGPRIEVHLEERASAARSCAVVLIENTGDNTLTVRREVRYVNGFQADIDRLYGFGMQWQRGYKTE